MNYQKDKEYNLKYATNDGETKEVELKPEKDMTTPEVIMRLKNDNKDFFKLLESKKLIENNLTDFQEKLIKAMEVLGFYYDDINSHDNYIKFNAEAPTNMEAFKSWNELEDWIKYVVIDDPEEAKLVDTILNKCNNNKDISYNYTELDESVEYNTGDSSIASNTGFYIGDPCYVLPDEIYYGVWDEQYNFEDGKIIVKDGLAFLVHGTAYGDGEYFDDIGTSYGVDSGTLAVVPFELIKKPEIMPSEGDYEYGRFVAGTNATLDYRDGVFTFKVNGKEIVIDTDPAYDDYEYEEDED